jgi:adenylosuccinate lyase
MWRQTRRAFSQVRDLAISPLDGRYYSKVEPLAEYFSEKAFMKYRIQTEVEWMKHLSKQNILILNKEISKEQFSKDLEDIYSDKDFYSKVKDIEKVTNHDIKAVEYYIKEFMKGRSSLSPYLEYVHFTCTSEDVNNIAYALMLRDARNKVVSPDIAKLTSTLTKLAQQTKDAKMMGRTHGQPATPTSLGKELANYCYRLEILNSQANKVEFAAKLNGAVGNYNAHVFVYPEFNWPEVSRTFVEGLGLQWSPYSTQIENHDSMCEYFGRLKHLNTVLLGFSRDMWHYISLGYFKQHSVKGEIGSSTMPHKINPIDFENAEGNLGVANAILGHLTDKLPMTRFQRDLSDSTVLRNIGSALGYTILSTSSLQKGLSRVEANRQRLEHELSNHWELLAEPIQMFLRRQGVANPYEKIKEVTRGAHVTEQTIKDFIDKIELDDKSKEKLRKLTPDSYTGLASQLVEELPKHVAKAKK